jgi:hypothetical protein
MPHRSRPHVNNSKVEHPPLLSGVTTTSVRYLGAIHDFVTMNGLSDKPTARSAIVLPNAMVRQARSSERVAGPG